MEALIDNQNNTDSETQDDLQLTDKKKKVRNKNKVYPEERKQVLNRLMSILMKDNENTFCSHEIESNEQKKNQIEELNEDILKYFNVSTWSAFKQNQIVEKKAISTIRSIFKEMNVDYETYT
jgi:hypothetical protein